MGKFKEGDLVRLIRTNSQGGGKFGVEGEVLEVIAYGIDGIFARCKFIPEYVLYGPGHLEYRNPRTPDYNPLIPDSCLELFHVEYKLDQVLDESEDLL